MRKIQWDTVTGVSEVDIAAEGCTTVSAESVFEYLRDARPGVVYFSVVSEETFEWVRTMYGIRPAGTKNPRERAFEVRLGLLGEFQIYEKGTCVHVVQFAENLGDALKCLFYA